MQNLMNQRVDDYRLRLRGREFVPLMLGGMGVDISTRRLALVMAQEGGIGHISDAMVPTVIDKDFKTRYVADKLKKYKGNVEKSDKSIVQFDLAEVVEAQRRHVEEAMAAKKGDGAIFINCMEKLTMNNPRETLRARLHAALDAGIDGITLSAGLHLGSFELMADHPRFHDAYLGIIVSSVRALKLFLKRASKFERMPDYIVVEGPLAGGHLGFGPDDWQQYDLATITGEVLTYLKEAALEIPVIPAGGVFTGTDAVELMAMGAQGVQVSTRFTVSHECGLPEDVKQEYFKAQKEDVIVNTISPTGYPMRMLKNSPAIGSGLRPNCESYGYLLDAHGHCSYIDAYNTELEKHPDERKISVLNKTCLCTHMRKFNVWTCGETVYRLKDTTRKLADGTFQLLSALDVFRDYQFSTAHAVAQPAAVGA